MNHRPLSAILLIALPLLFMIGDASAAIWPSRLTGVAIEDNGEYRQATPREIYAYVRIKRDGEWIHAAKGMPLFQGDHIETAKNGVSVRIQYRGDEGILRPGTRVALQRQGHDIKSFFGAIWTLVRGSNRRFAVEGESWMAGVDGTAFYLALDAPRQEPDVIVETGRVRLIFKGGYRAPVVLNAYDGYLNGKVYNADVDYSKLDNDHGKYRSSVGRTGLSGVVIPRVSPYAVVSPMPEVDLRLREIRRWVDGVIKATGGPAD